MATATDEVRIDEWQSALVLGVLASGRKEFGSAQYLYQADRPLYSPTLAQPQHSLPPGEYECAKILLTRDADASSGLGFISYSYFRCSVAVVDGLRRFEKITGSQRTKGVILDAPDIEGDVYLGTWQVSDEQDYLDYGVQAERNDAAVVQSLGDGRWRMISTGSLLGGRTEILELKPVGWEAP